VFLLCYYNIFNILQCTHPHSPFLAQDVEYQMNTDNPECNQGGLVPVIGREVEFNKTIVSKLTIYLPITDLRDFTEKQRFKASLLENFDGVRITMPTMPSYLMQAEDIESLHAQEGTNKCWPTERSHKVLGVALEANESQQTKQVTYRFPDGMTCNNKLFNDDVGDDYKLAANLRFKEVIIGKGAGGVDVKQLCPLVFWQIAIDSETPNLETKKAASDNDFAKAMERMSNMMLNNP
jgi:hypothetical protein